MANVQNYQCLACGGPLAFDATLGKLKCPYCDSEFSAEELEAALSEKNDGKDSKSESEDSNNIWGDDSEGLKSYSCPSCGANIVCTPTTASTSCPYCDNPTIVESQFAGSNRPDLIIPFKIEKKVAVGSLKDFYKGKPLLPNKFSQSNHIEETKGVYVPFYFFDGKASGDAVFRATKSSSHRSGDKTVRITKHYECSRSGEMDFSMVPVDASKQMDNALMDSIEPFDYSALSDFSTGFLPGFFADIPDETQDDCLPRAKTRCENSTLRALEDTVRGYSTKSVLSQNISFKKTAVHYGMLPVYLLNTRYDDKKFTYAINGQTGKVVGGLPISTPKAILRFFMHLIISAVVVVVVGIILTYLEVELPTEKTELALWGGGISLIGAIFLLMRDFKKMKTVHIADSAKDYAKDGVRLSFQSDDFKRETREVIAHQNK